MDWCANQLNRFASVRGSQDSAIGSYKALPLHDSQGSEFSQVATQDVFSQNIITPQMDAGKPSSMYEKWKNKQAMLKRDTGSSQDVAGSISSSQPGPSKMMPASGLGRWDSKSSLNNVCAAGRGPSTTRKPAECDERKLLDLVVTTVKDCNNEVKSTLLYLMEHLEKVADVSNGQLAKTMSSFLENIWTHEEGLKKLIKDQDASRNNVTDLEKKLVEKDSRISTLQEQVSSTRADELQGYAKTVKAEIQTFQAQFLHKIQDLQSLAEESQKQQQDFLADYQSNSHKQIQQSENLSKAIKSGFKESEKRIVGDVSKALHKLESKQTSQHMREQTEMRGVLDDHITNVVQAVTTNNSVAEQALQEQTNTVIKAFTCQFQSMLKSLEQTIKTELQRNKEERATPSKVLVTSVGTTTEDMSAQHVYYNGQERNYLTSGGQSCVQDKGKQPMLDHRQFVVPAHYTGTAANDHRQFDSWSKPMPLQDSHYNTEKLDESSQFNRHSSKPTPGQDSHYNLEKPDESTQFNRHSSKPTLGQDSHYNLGKPSGTNKPNEPVFKYTTRASALKPANSDLGGNGPTKGYDDNKNAQSFYNIYRDSASYVGTRSRYQMEERRQDPLPIRVAAPFVSPFQAAGSVSVYKKGPSPCAVVAPQRQTWTAGVVQSPANSCRTTRQTMQTTASPMVAQSKKKKPKKRMYTHYKSKGQKKYKKCPLEGLKAELTPSDWEDEAPDKSSTEMKAPLQPVRYLSQWQAKQQSPCAPMAGSVRNQTYLPPGYAHSRQMSSMTRQAVDAYKFDECDRQEITPRRAARRVERSGSQKPNSNTDAGYHRGSSVRHPNASSRMDDENQSPARARCTDAESMNSSPAISVMDMALNRKIRGTPFCRPSVRRTIAGPSFLRRPSNQNTSPARTLLDDF